MMIDLDENDERSDTTRYDEPPTRRTTSGATRGAQEREPEAPGEPWLKPEAE